MLDGTQLHPSDIPLSLGTKSVTHWAHEDTLRFAVSLKTCGGHVINIKELKPTSTPLLCHISSFPIKPCDGDFSFSPAFSHASFVHEKEAIILDIQNSRCLLQTRFPLGCSRGEFSHDGHFFVCGTLEELRIWQKTPTGYLPWSSLKLRAHIESHSISPTTIKILCYGQGGLQLFHPNNHSSPLSPTKVLAHDKQHLVTFSTNGMYIAMAQPGSGDITVLNSHLDTPQQLKTGMETQDIKIVGNSLFAVDRHKLICWNLDAHGVRRGTFDKPLTIDHRARCLTLSHDCSQIAFMVDRKVFLYNPGVPGLFTKYVQAYLPKLVSPLVTEYTAAYEVLQVKFSPDQQGLWLHTVSVGGKIPGYLVELGIRDGRILGGATVKDMSWDDPFFSHEHYRVHEWVEDSGGKKLLWLPPSLRVFNGNDVKWDGNFLALLDGYLPEPVIIQFHP